MEPESDDDALLVAAVDDPEAFAQFYRHHVRGVLAYFRRRVADAELARVDVALAAPTAVLAARAAGCTQGTEGGRAGRWARADRTTVLPSAAIGGTRQDCPG